MKQFVKIDGETRVPPRVQKQTFRPDFIVAFNSTCVLQKPIHQDLSEVTCDEVSICVLHFHQDFANGKVTSSRGNPPHSGNNGTLHDWEIMRFGGSP